MKNTRHKGCRIQHLPSTFSSENQGMDQLCASESPRKLFKNKIPSPALEILLQWVWGRAWECVFETSSFDDSGVWPGL